MNFASRYATFRQQVEAGIDRWVPPATTPPERLHQAMRYALEAGGKRIRPILVLAGHALLGGSADPIPAAVAVEALHTYSLIHDDLPAMDNADLRRGRPTCHRQFDEATAVLAGDALLTLAFDLLARGYADQPALAIGLVAELARAAGSEDLIGGQSDDTALAGHPHTLEALRGIHRRKTGALLAASLALGVRLGGGSPAQVAHARTAGFALGLAFQIVDDLLDATASAAQLGKDVGNDASHAKVTWVTLRGLEGAREDAAALTAEATAELQAIGGDPTFLCALADSLTRRET